jgi:hypothetical protein
MHGAQCSFASAGKCVLQHPASYASEQDFQIKPIVWTGIYQVVSCTAIEFFGQDLPNQFDPHEIIHCVATPEQGIFLVRDEQEALDFAEYRNIQEQSNIMDKLDQEDPEYLEYLDYQENKEDLDDFDPNNDEDLLPPSYFGK